MQAKFRLQSKRNKHKTFYKNKKYKNNLQTRRYI